MFYKLLSILAKLYHIVFSLFLQLDMTDLILSVHYDIYTIVHHMLVIFDKYIKKEQFNNADSFYPKHVIHSISFHSPGLTDLLHNKEGTEIVPLQPGHYEAYDLATSGKVTFRERVRFHDVGQVPAYKTMISSYGRCPFP